MTDDLSEKKEKLKELITRLDETDVTEVKEEAKKLLESLSPLEIPEIEQELIEEGRSPESISKLCDIHVEIFKESLENKIDPGSLKSGHPLRSFIEENELISNDAEQISLYNKSLQSASGEKFNQLVKDFSELIGKLLSIDRTHYERLEVLVFPHLERRGISAVPRILWKKHQENMSYLKKLTGELSKLGSSSKEKEVLEKLQELGGEASNGVINMVFREENILYPTLENLLNDGEWKAIKSQSQEIGYYGSYSSGEEWGFDGELVYPNEVSDFIDEEEFKDLPSDLRNVIGEEVPEKIIFGTKEEGDLSLDTGYLSIKELNQLLKNLPIDITYIDKNDRVRFFSDKNRIFNRTRSIIGRPVKYCHPPSSVDVVQEIVQKFKDGEKDEAEFWLQMGENFVHISYYAVRDEGKYLGAVEVTQEISKLREIEGNKTLLDW